MEVETVRVRREYRFGVGAPREQIFPLLCPVREREWVPDWKADMVFSRSGIAEDHCVFTTSFAKWGRGVWVVSAYDPVGFSIGFTVFVANEYVERIDIALTALEPTRTEVRWVRTFTALSDVGTEFIRSVTHASLDERMVKLAERLREHVKKMNEPLPSF